VQEAATASQPFYSGAGYQSSAPLVQPVFGSYQVGSLPGTSSQPSSQAFSSLGYQSTTAPTAHSYSYPASAPAASQPAFSTAQQTSYQSGGSAAGAQGSVQSTAYQFAQYAQPAASQFGQQYEAPAASSSANETAPVVPSAKPVVRKLTLPSASLPCCLYDCLNFYQRRDMEA
jgi:hypothetical protein